MKGKCQVPGCSRPVRIKKHRLCNTHVAQYYRKGAITSNIRSIKKRAAFVLSKA